MESYLESHRLVFKARKYWLQDSSLFETMLSKDVFEIFEK